MMMIVKSFFRGLPIAALAAAGTLAVTRGNLWEVAATSFAINIWWQANVRAVQNGTNRWAFSVGAACGSAMTVWLLR